jgi:hypothetical protein
MLLFGHRFIESEKFYKITTQEDIEKTPPNSCVYLSFDEDNIVLYKYLQKNNLRFALHVDTLEALIYAHNLGSDFIVVPSDLAKTAQAIAESYLFDAKILVQITDDNEIEKYAQMGIDGAVYPQGIVTP